MDVLTNETPLDVLSRAACLLHYNEHEKSPPAVKRSFSQLDLDCDDVIVASSHHARLSASSSGHERDWCDRLIPSQPPPPTYGSCKIEVPVDILRPVTGRAIGQYKCPRLEGGFLGGATTKNADYYCTSAEADTTRKCASTQTQFSSFQLPPTANQQLHITAGGGSYLPPPYPSASVTSRQHANSSPRQPSDADFERRGLAELLPPYVSTNLSSIASSRPAERDDLMNLPLNLTVRQDDPCSMTTATNVGTTAADDGPSQLNAVLTGSARPKQSITTSCSPSEATLLQPWAKALPFVQRRQETHHRDSSPCLRLKEPAHRPTSSAVTSDCCQEIEEHFLRSLGRHYLLTTAATSSDAHSRKSHSMTLPHERYDVIGDATTTFCGDRTPSNISVNGSVDDHFAKSLGATWNRIKEHLEMTPDGTTTLNSNSNSSSNQRQQVLAPLGGTVDDHFAKALGDAWFKIKAATEKI